MKNGSQHMIRFHVDDVMLSHINPKVNDNEDDGKVKVDMSSYMKNMLDDFPVNSRRVKRQAHSWVKAYITLDRQEAKQGRCRSLSHNGGERTICMQMSKTQHSAYDCAAVHANKRTECIRLEQTHQDDDTVVLRDYQREPRLVLSTGLLQRLSLILILFFIGYGVSSSY